MGCCTSTTSRKTTKLDLSREPTSIIELKKDNGDERESGKWLDNPRISLAKQSMLVCQLLLNRRDGTFIWDLERMKTDISEWDGLCGFDGLEEESTDRDEIGMIILKALIANGTCANTVTTHGRTALQITALAGDLAYCKELVEKGADVDAKNEAGETALFLVRQWHKRPKDLSHIITYLESFNGTS